VTRAEAELATGTWVPWFTELTATAAAAAVAASSARPPAASLDARLVRDADRDCRSAAGMLTFVGPLLESPQLPKTKPIKAVATKRRPIVHPPARTITPPALRLHVEISPFTG
jgi:hypothetical protein